MNSICGIYRVNDFRDMVPDVRRLDWRSLLRYSLRRLTRIALLFPTSFVALGADRAADVPESSWLRQTAYATWFLAAATLFLAFGTVWFMRRQMRDGRISTQLQVLLQMSARYESEAMINARRTTAMALGPDSPVAVSDPCAQVVLDFFEMVGYLGKHEHLDLKMVDNEFGTPLGCYWSGLRDYVVRLRTELQDPELYLNLEWLAIELSERDRRARQPDRFTSQIVSRFMDTESNLT